MKTFISILYTTLLLCGISPLLSQVPHLEWAQKFGSAFEDGGLSVSVDPFGYLYISGGFQGSIDFDGGPGYHPLTSNGGLDGFVLKTSPDGNFVWACNIGGTEFDAVTEVATDAASNVYLLGIYNSKVDFDPGPGTYFLYSADSQDIFLLKLDASGNFLWVRTIEGGGIEMPSGLALDTSGNVYVGGYFENTPDFDPGPGTYTITSYGYMDAFLQKLDSDGNLLWVKRTGGSYDDFYMDIATDNAGNVYTIGDFAGTIDLDPGPVSNLAASKGFYDIFIQKFNANGNLAWAGSMGGIGADLGTAIEADAVGNIYTTGSFSEIVDFDLGIGVFSIVSSPVKDAFVQKLDQAGNFQWAACIWGEGEIVGNSIAIDKVNQPYILGKFEEVIDVDPGPSILTLHSNGNEDLFLIKLNEEGELSWARHCGGALDDTGASVAADGDGNVFFTGSFRDLTDFDPSAGEFFLTSTGSEADIFLTKWSQGPDAVLSLPFPTPVSLFPNPTSGWVSCDLGAKYDELTVQITTILGQIIQQDFYKNAERIDLEIKGPKGMYFLHLSDGNGREITTKLIKE